MKKKQLDTTDKQILNLLQQDASLSQRQIAEATHISPATALRRIKSLKEAGIIEREVAILNPALLGGNLQIIAEVTLDRQDYTSQEQYESYLLTRPEVQQCYRVNAGPDFILITTVENMGAYEKLAREIFSSKYNVRSVRTFFSTKRSKFTTQQPIDSI